MSNRSSLVGIGISTRDRWRDLELTLQRLQEKGLHHCETIVIDDFSQQSIPVHLSAEYPWVRFIRSERQMGYIAQRNRLAKLLTADTYLSLDDDSYIEAGDVFESANWLFTHPKIIALGFPIVLGDNPLKTEVGNEYHSIRFFIGCAHLLNRRHFLELGGYREELETHCEETEFTLRACGQGFGVLSYPAVTVRHLVSKEGRNNARINRFLTRNDLWIAAWHYPFIFMVMSFLNCLPRQFKYAAHRQHWRSVLQGFCLAMISLPRIWKLRSPLSYNQYWEWRRRSYPISGRSAKS